MPPRVLAALCNDPRIELTWPSELALEWVPGRRDGVVLVVAEHDPLGALAYAAMCGLGNRLVMAISPRCASETADLLAAGALVVLKLPLDARAVDTLVDVLSRDRRPYAAAAPARLSIDLANHTVRYRSATVRLTRREFALLRCLMERRGRAVGAEELLSVAWADNARARASRRVLELYVHQLRKKLGALGLSDSLTTVRGFGYALTTNSS